MSALLFGVPGKLKTLLTRVPADNATQIAKLDDTITSRAPAGTAVSNAVLTPGRSALLDNLDASISSVATSVAAVKLQSVIYSTAGTDTFTVPTGVTVFYLTMQGAGGGGGGVGSNTTGFNGYTGGSGGGAGVVCIGLPVKCSGGQVWTITVGAGGAGGIGKSGSYTHTDGNVGNATYISLNSSSPVEAYYVNGGSFGNRSNVSTTTRTPVGALVGPIWVTTCPFGNGMRGGASGLPGSPSSNDADGGEVSWGRESDNGGNSTSYGGGGGGGGHSFKGAGGLGGAGASSQSAQGGNGVNGTFGSGGGGGGGAYPNNLAGSGGAGGAGWAMIEF